MITVGLDVHEVTIAVFALRGLGQDEELREIPTDPRAVQKLFRKLVDECEVRACSEAGHFCFDVHRQLTGLGVACAVISPALIRRKLAPYFRAGYLTAIQYLSRLDGNADRIRALEAEPAKIAEEPTWKRRCATGR